MSRDAALTENLSGKNDDGHEERISVVFDSGICEIPTCMIKNGA